MDDSKYLETINRQSATIESLAVEKNKKVNSYQTIIIALIIAVVFITCIYGSTMFYAFHSIYGYDFSISNTNENKNTNENGGEK